MQVHVHVGVYMCVHLGKYKHNGSQFKMLDRQRRYLNEL